MKHNSGDRVMARWPGSTLYYQAVVLETGVGECKVVFEEGSEFFINEKFIKTEGAMRTVTKTEESKSPLRTPTRRSPARRSPARRSPARRSPVRRSPSRRSPGRKSPTRQSPARKSPSRRSPARKSPARKSPAKKSPARKSPAQKSSAEKSSAEKSPEQRSTVTPEIIAVTAMKKFEIQEEIARSSTERENSVLRGRQSTTITRRQTALVADNVPVRRSSRMSSVKEFESDPEDDLEAVVDKEQLLKNKKSESEVIEYPEKSQLQYFEFGGWKGALALIFILPSSVLLVHLYSNMIKEGSPGFRIPTNWRKYLDLQVAGIYFGFVVLQSVLSVVPVGKITDGLPDKQGRLQYRSNGFVSAFVTLALVGVLQYYKYPVTLLIDKYIPLIISGIIFGLLIAVGLYLRGGKAPIATLNSYGNTGNIIYDFWLGREINPRFGRFDVKVALYRTAIIGTIVLNAVLLLKNSESQHEYPATLVVSAGMQLFYMLEFLWFEDSWSTSFGVMYEGVGYMTAMGCCLYPFIPTLITKFLVDNRVEFPITGLVLLLAVFVSGYVIYRSSNAQKSEFRKNPLNPALAHMETIPTSRGKKLLTTGWWGWVRHPNYLGDILMHWVLASTCGVYHWIPYLVPLTITLLLLHRAKRDENRCRSRYESAWDCYTERVRFSVLPKVF